jgi:hypothetical protein
VLISAAYWAIATPFNQTISDDVVGNWEGSCEVFADFKIGVYPSTYAEDQILILLSIDKTGNVTGKIGDAILKDAQLKRNRNKLGELIGINSDYIISNANIKGKISPLDLIESRTISIPFNCYGKMLKGSINLKESLEYPDPLFPDLELNLKSD